MAASGPPPPAAGGPPAGGGAKGPPIINDRYQLVRRMRDTLVGEVWAAMDCRTNRKVVVKVYFRHLVEKRVTRDGVPIQEDPMTELRIHRKISQAGDMVNRFIVRLEEVLFDRERMYAVLEFCELGDFFGFVERRRFHPEYAKFYAKQLLTAVYTLHQYGVAHRDLSLENMLLTDKRILKVCDFGVAVECKAGSQLLNKDERGRPGKVRYMAPEVYQCAPYDPQKADIWSCGVIIFVMLVGGFPFERPDFDDDRFVCIVQGGLDELLRRWRCEVPPRAAELLKAIFRFEDKRVGWEGIIRLPWLEEPANLPPDASPF